MIEQNTISETEESMLDFNQLRKKALKYIEQLAEKTWTDYNTHDPGITLLESLIYALTDLSYRTNLSMEDLLASNPTIDFTPSLFYAEKILPAHPITLNDIEKKLLDNDKVKNIKVYKLDDGERGIYFNQADNTLGGAGDEDNKLKINGLYEVEVEAEVEIESQTTNNSILENIKSALHRDRNLCEDLVHVNTITPTGVTIHATVILSLESDVNKILARIYFSIYKFLNPKKEFYTLEQLQEEKIPLEEIYEGPLLEGGFLKEVSIQKVKKEGVIYFSDVLAAMWSSDEDNDILSIHEHPKKPLMITTDDKQQQNDNGFLSVGANTQLVFDTAQITQSEMLVNFETTEETSIESTVNIAQVKKEFIKLRDNYKSQLTSERTPLLPPEGTPRTITEYLSVQEDLPKVYGVGKNVPPILSTNTERLAQSKQLQGFLLLFDQLMGNYLAQLSHVGSLFSFNSQQHTYFSQALKNITDIRELLDGYKGTPEDDWDDFMTTTFPSKLTTILEPTNSTKFRQRRHQFLDHLLARFSETYIDTAIFLDPENILGDKAIKAKEHLLSSYDLLSKQRGKGFNYLNTSMWGYFSEITGYEQWVRAKLGISDTTRSSIYSPKNFLKFKNDDAVSIDFGSYKNLTSWTIELWAKLDTAAVSGTIIDIQNSSSENILQIKIDENTRLSFTLGVETTQSLEIFTLKNRADKCSKKITEAIGLLKAGDTSTVKTALEAAKTNVKLDFTTASIKLQTAIGEVSNLKLLYTIDEEKAIEDAIKVAKIEVDKSLLPSKKITEAINLLKTGDTSAVKTALEGAETALNTEETTGEVLDFTTAGTKLQIAINEISNLGSSYTDKEKTAITAAITAAKTVIINQDYDKISWNQWIHFAIGYDQGTSKAKIFVNGNIYKEISLLNIPSFDMPSFDNATAYLGNNKDNDAVFTGEIAELQLWNKSLSQEELVESIRDEDLDKQLHLTGFWKAEITGFQDFNTSGTNHGIIQGVPSYVKTSPFGDHMFSQEFRQGTDDRVQINFDSHKSLTSWTLELWAKPYQTETLGTIIEIQDSCLENFLLIRTNNNSNNQPELSVTLANEAPRVIKTGNSWDQWIHITVSYDQVNSMAIIFINGNEVENITLSKNIPSFEDALVYLGNNKNNSAVFKGAIAELRLWNNSRSTSQLDTNKGSTLNGNENGLEGLWKTVQPFYNRKDLQNNQGSITGSPSYLNASIEGKGNFHVIEHILLRPKDIYTYHFLKPYLINQKDPYSNQITVICPRWINPFNNGEYRRHFIHMIQSEAPAHIYINMLWITHPPHLWIFEYHYRKWLEGQSDYFNNPDGSLHLEYQKAHQNFIETLNYLNTVYSSTSQAVT